MRIAALVSILLSTTCLILGLLQGFDPVFVALAAVIGVCWVLSVLLKASQSFHSILFVLTAVSAGFLAGFGAQLPLAAAALSFALGAWDLCMTMPRLSAFAASARERFARAYIMRCTAWIIAGFLLVLFSHAPRQESQSIYALIGLALLAFVVILFLLWRVRMTFAGESAVDPQENG